MKEKKSASIFDIESQDSLVEVNGTLELDTSLELQADLECYRLQVQQDMKDSLRLMWFSLPMHLVLAVVGAVLFWTVALRCATSNALLCLEATRRNRYIRLYSFQSSSGRLAAMSPQLQHRACNKHVRLGLDQCLV